MNGWIRTTLASLLALAAASAMACGEGRFNMGAGLRYQAYLAPRPAVVLVVDESPQPRADLYAGLSESGHRLTVASSVEQAQLALAQTRFDVVITDVAQVAAFSASGSRLLPVVAADAAADASLQQRFSAWVAQGASLRQYLRGIDRTLRASGVP